MKLPNPHQAVVEIDKLREYCLSRVHPRGRHKARVFEERLVISAEHAERLQGALLEAAYNNEVIEGISDAYGRRYMIDLEVTGPSGRAMIRSAWIIRVNEEFPCFVTCYVL
jgi:hypothetical protein